MGRRKPKKRERMGGRCVKNLRSILIFGSPPSSFDVVWSGSGGFFSLEEEAVIHVLVPFFYHLGHTGNGGAARR